MQIHNNCNTALVHRCTRLCYTNGLDCMAITGLICLGQNTRYTKLKFRKLGIILGQLSYRKLSSIC